MAEKRIKYTSPKGIAVYPWVNQPDTKFDPDGAYRTRLRLNEAENQEFIALIDKQYDEAVEAEILKAYEKAQAKKPALKLEAFRKTVKLADKPYKAVLDDEGDETGEVDVSFKSNATFTDKKTQKKEKIKLHLFDAKGKPTTARIGGGSTIKISFNVIPFPPGAFGTGISLRMLAVQVIDLQTFGGGANADNYGFGEEDGYEDPGAEGQEFFGGEETTHDADSADAGDDPDF